MRPEDFRLRDTQDWVARSMEDLENAKHDLGAPRPFVRGSLFHCQQAVEKACKGFLTWHDQAIPRTHSLSELGHLCAELDSELGALGRRAAPLNVYAVRFRYPGEPYQPTLREAKTVLELAEQIVAQILARLPGETQPTPLQDAPGTHT